MMRSVLFGSIHVVLSVVFVTDDAICVVCVLQPRERGHMRFHKIQNVQIALDFLRLKGVCRFNYF